VFAEQMCESTHRSVPQLRHEVAVVTGGGRGIGRAIAEALARAGSTVVLAARTRADLDVVAGAIHEFGGRALVLPTDVTDEQAVARLFDESTELASPPTLLVNAAGTWTEVGPLERADPKAWWRDVEVSLKGTFLCTRAALPTMLARQKGRIINVSSYAGISARPYATGYASAKAAVLRFTDSLAAELTSRGVLVFAISPGFVRTRLVEEAASSEYGRKYLPELSERDDALDPRLAGALAVNIASGQLDSLAGRFLHVLDDTDELLRRADEVTQQDLYTLRLRT
jgi:NAD(P)-dependent dehydrogenase (short-subunit alcohol dehydrogenase family)